MFKRNFLMAVIAVLVFAACTNETEEYMMSSNVHSLSVGIESGAYVPETGLTRASMEAVIRVKWTEGDEVSVVNATTGKILGSCLKAKESGESVTFSGDVTGTINQGDVLYYVYPRITENENETAFSETNVSLASQTYDYNDKGKVNFYGYAQDEAGTTTNISKKIAFNLVTSYVHLNMSNLPAKGFALNTIDISNINEGFKWSLSGTTLTADAYEGKKGISVNCSNVPITKAGNAVVRFAIPETAASDEVRTVTVNNTYRNNEYYTDELKPSTYYNQLYSSWESDYVAQIGDVQYSSLAEAVEAVTTKATITLLKNVTDGGGIFLGEGEKNITIDLNGKTYTAKSPAVGSSGTQTQAFHLEKGNTVTIKNGTLDVATAADGQMKMLIQNYCNLTLHDVNVNGTNLKTSKSQYVVSNNCGTVNFTGSTSITAPAGFRAFDVCKFASYDAPTVNVNTTGTITGQVEVTGGTLNVTAGTFKTTGERNAPTSPTLLVKKENSIVSVSGGSFTSDHDVAVRVEGGNVKLNEGTFTGVEGAVCFPGAGASIVIDGGTYTASDNAVLIGQGSDREGDPNTVNISDGTFNGQIKSDGYIACGIYAPWKDEITVTGGTFNITNGSGVVVRGGKLDMSGAKFNFTDIPEAATTGWVGDSENELPCGKDVVVDKKAAYPEVKTINVTAPKYETMIIESTTE